MIQGRDFVITGLQPWDTSIGSNAKDIAVEISRHNRVLYVDTPLDMLTYKRGEDTPDFRSRAKAVSQDKPILRQLNPNMWVVDLPVLMFPANKMPVTSLFRLLNRWNNKLIFNSLMPVIKELGFSDYILFTDNDIYRSLYASRILKPSCSVYYRRDYLLGVDYWRKYGTLLEPEIVRNNDLVLANSQYLADGVRCYNAQSYDVGQGVDLSSFDLNIHYQKPQNIACIASPIIGYVGVLTSLRLDIELLLESAKRLPDFSFVFVGPEDEKFRSSALHNLPNVHFLGQQPVDLMPNYISAFDICINPQLVNEVTVGNYPRKVDEYLALGKPVIAVDTPMMKLFENYVWLISGVDNFVAVAQEIVATKEQDREKMESRCEFAKGHTWENSVNRMYDYITRIIENGSCRDKK